MRLLRATLIPLFLTLLSGCAVTPPPVVTPPPPAVQRYVRTTIWAGGAALASGSVALLSDDGRTVTCHFDGPRVTCPLDMETPAPYGAHLSVAAEGYRPVTVNFALTGEPNQDIPDVVIEAVPTLVRIRLQGRRGMADAAGRLVSWRSTTGFQIVEQMAHGREADAVRFLQSTKRANASRVLLMAVNLFNLSPSDGLSALPATLRMAEQQGRWLGVTVLADTKFYPDLDYRAMAVQAAAICQASPACPAMEIGNELWSLHSTQASALGSLSYLLSIRDAMKAVAPDVAISLGSTHADQDESDRMRDGDFLTIHGARDDGDEGWRWVRHSNEQRALADAVNRWAINDEPRRDDLDCGRQIGMAMLARMFNLGDTFHSKNGLFALPLEGAEAAAFNCRARGWEAIPDDWWGDYRNAGFAGSPVKSFSGAVRIYSSVNGGRGLTLVLGATPALRIDWADEWPNRQQLISESGALLFQVSR